jgi:hypothetical protein
LLMRWWWLKFQAVVAVAAVETIIDSALIGLHCLHYI